MMYIVITFSCSNMESLRVVGLTSEEYEQLYVKGRSENFQKALRSATRYFIYAEDIKTGNLCKILLDEIHHKYDLHWGNFSYGIMKKIPIMNIPELSYVPLVETILNIDFDDDAIKNNLFEFSNDGEDYLCPHGYTIVHMDKFKLVTGRNTT